jgi:hypothetical protein
MLEVFICATPQNISAVTSIEDVFAFLPPKFVVACFSVKPVLARQAFEDVVPIAAPYRVVTFVTESRIIAIQKVNRVVPGKSVNEVCAAIRGDKVALRRAASAEMAREYQ